MKNILLLQFIVLLLSQVEASKEIKMCRCPIANEIAIHCDDEEIYCPKCTSPMVYSPFDTQVLMCTDDGCLHSIDTEDK